MAYFAALFQLFNSIVLLFLLFILMAILFYCNQLTILTNLHVTHKTFRRPILWICVHYLNATYIPFWAAFSSETASYAPPRTPKKKDSSRKQLPIYRKGNKKKNGLEHVRLAAHTKPHCKIFPKHFIYISNMHIGLYFAFGIIIFWYICTIKQSRK